MLLLTLAFSGSLQAVELKVAVAANFAAVLQNLAPDFTQQTGHALRISAASSGTLYAQIRNGAPFDVFLSADLVRPQRLIEEGHAEAEQAFVYARGVLVLFAPAAVLSRSLEAEIFDPKRKFLAMANPRTAPYGTAAEQVLDHLYTRGGRTLSAQRVVGSSIGQAFQYVMTGNADMGLVALSQVLATRPPVSAQHLLRIDRRLYAPLDQGGVILKRTPHPLAARRFVGFLRDDAIQARIEAAGYVRPAEPVWP